MSEAPLLMVVDDDRDEHGSGPRLQVSDTLLKPITHATLTQAIQRYR